MGSEHARSFNILWIIERFKSGSCQRGGVRIPRYNNLGFALNKLQLLNLTPVSGCPKDRKGNTQLRCILFWAISDVHILNIRHLGEAGGKCNNVLYRICSLYISLWNQVHVLSLKVIMMESSWLKNWSLVLGSTREGMNAISWGMWGDSNIFLYWVRLCLGTILHS